MDDSGSLNGLAQFFRGIGLAFGTTTLPADAPPEKVRTFVFAWLGIVAFFVVWILVLFYIFAC